MEGGIAESTEYVNLLWVPKTGRLDGPRIVCISIGMRGLKQLSLEAYWYSVKPVGDWRKGA